MILNLLFILFSYLPIGVPNISGASTVSTTNYLAIKKNHPDWEFEYRLDVIGYTLMDHGRLHDGIKVLELNAKENPKSGNAFDSLADGYFRNNDLALSKENYQKALSLSPDNNNAKEML